jgi:capsular polysaccharide transport system permease protein
MFSKLFVFLVLIPGGLGAIYFAFISDRIYDSQAVIALKSVSGDSRALVSLTGGDSAIGTDSAGLRQFMLSYDMLEHLEKTVGVSKPWSAPSLDIIGRLWPENPSRARLMRYYQRRIEVDYDPVSTMITVDATSFEPAHAKRIAAEMVAEANRYTNNVSADLAQIQQASMEKETQDFYDRLLVIRDKLETFQSANGILDAEGAAKSEASLVSKLESEEAAASAELTQALTYLSPDAFGVQVLRQKLASLDAELERQRDLSVSPGTTGAKGLEYRSLKADREFLERGYARAQAALEQDKLDASRDAKKLIVIQSPNLPDEPQHLAGLIDFGLYLLILLAVFTVVRLMLAVHRERAVS